ncbi:response regulator [Paenibacillus chungangensis]|uniref:Response regulator n=1 Tax=Paenibacillus chungangensis TaxID=696535 RepID=A0ABW3HU54_9BACL
MCKTILLVEDHEMNRDMLKRRLCRRGFHVLTAVDGQEGIDTAVLKQPDIILMDMSLPVMDGWEATKRLKRKEETKRIPIIALTAHAMSEDAAKAYDAGCDDFDTKPVDFERLLGKIQKAQNALEKADLQ